MNNEDHERRDPQHRSPPWERVNPKARKGISKKLSTAQKAKAKTKAKNAGRRYPNLVDNMREARRAKKTATPEQE